MPEPSQTEQLSLLRRKKYVLVVEDVIDRFQSRKRKFLFSTRFRRIKMFLKSLLCLGSFVAILYFFIADYYLFHALYKSYRPEVEFIGIELIENNRQETTNLVNFIFRIHNRSLFHAFIKVERLSLFKTTADPSGTPAPANTAPYLEEVCVVQDMGEVFIPSQFFRSFFKLTGTLKKGRSAGVGKFKEAGVLASEYNGALDQGEPPARFFVEIVVKIEMMHLVITVKRSLTMLVPLRGFVSERSFEKELFDPMTAPKGKLVEKSTDEFVTTESSHSAIIFDRICSSVKLITYAEFNLKVMWKECIMEKSKEDENKYKKYKVTKMYNNGRRLVVVSEEMYSGFANADNGYQVKDHSQRYSMFWRLADWSLSFFYSKEYEGAFRFLMANLVDCKVIVISFEDFPGVSTQSAGIRSLLNSLGEIVIME